MLFIQPSWAPSQFLSEHWQVGIVGYVYLQLTGDSGPGAKLGPFESRVASIGPEIGYVFTFVGRDAYANVRGYGEFWAENRLQGYALFASVELPLGHWPALTGGVGQSDDVDQRVGSTTR